MAVYRADQAQVTFMTEPAAGGYVEQAPKDTAKTGSGADTDLDGNHEAGSTSLTVTDSTGFSVGDAILIGYWHDSTTATNENEIRQIEHITGNVIYLSAPTAFYHADGGGTDNVFEVTPTTANLQDADSQYINLIPGAYETVDVPDPEMAIEGRWFLGTTSKRAFYAAYSGQQTYAGSIGGFALLDGKALRYPIGKVYSTTTFTNDVTAMKRTFATALKKGDLYVTLAAASGDAAIAITTKVMFGRGSETSEIRQSTSVLATNTAGTIRLDYPLQFDHAAGDMHVIGTAASNTTIATTQTIPYTHSIKETVDLDSVSWHVHMLPSDETRANAFDRRYYGGKIGSMTISGEEGGMVTASWDGVNFLGMIHNQKTVDLSTDITTPFFADMQSIINSKVDFPTNEPYYFSQGEVTMFGQTIARIRSFSLSISNNEEPRYYIKKQMGRKRGPTEIREQRREYSLAVTLALPDAAAANTAQRTLFQEMLLEGNYGSATDFIRTGKKGFDVSITLTRGNVVTGFEDKITITIPDDGAAATGGNQQGAFIRTAPHNITEDNPFQVEADILFRNLSITVQDAEHYYP